MVNDNVQAKIVELIDWIKTGVETNAPILYHELLYRQIATYTSLIFIFLLATTVLAFVCRYCIKQSKKARVTYNMDDEPWNCGAVAAIVGMVATCSIAIGQTTFLVNTLVAPRVAVLEEVIRMVK